ncbi:MAG: AI-2E family transporter [Lentisphaeria bacterium]|jgi:predicted PurR-regulated permease PerM
MAEVYKHGRGNWTMNRIEQFAGIAVVALLVLGCLMVVRPFLSSLLWAGVLCYSTWPVFAWLNRLFRGRRSLAATVMVGLTALVLVAPFVVVGISLKESVRHVSGKVERLLEEGVPPPPAWLSRIPVVGDDLHSFWAEQVAGSGKAAGIPPGPDVSGEEGLPAAAALPPNGRAGAGRAPPAYSLRNQLQQWLLDSRGWLLHRGVDFGQALLQGVVQLSMSVFIAFFFFRDGERVVSLLASSITRIAGDQTQHYLLVVGKTVRGVVYGILGTALAQGLVAALGFFIVGAPSPMLLGVVTFFLSLLIPVGPPLVWVPVVLWLLSEGRMGAAVFMGIYGALGISGVDNVVRPYIISRGTNLPFILVFIGVVGGVMTFGFIGFFLGPVLLVMGYCLLNEWVAVRQQQGGGGLFPATPPDPAG